LASARSSSPWSYIYVSVALTTMGTLLLELSLTRVFSVVFYYHFAFLAISIALFGLGGRRRYTSAWAGLAPRIVYSLSWRC
jgi:lipid A disaccharide synthetase